MFHRTLRACFLAGILVCTLSTLAAQQPNISIQVVTAYDYPGAGNSTVGQQINSRGDIAGHFFDGTADRGFVRLKNGTFTAPIVEPNDNGNFTFATGINAARTVCGYYFSATDNFFHGYFLSGHTTFTEFDIDTDVSTFLIGINDAGDFCGSFGSATQAVGAFFDIGGDLQFFSVPGATRTDASAINLADEIVGDYQDSALVFHSFLREPDGTLTFPLDFPGSTSTILVGLNDRGLITGRYTDASGGVHGMLLKRPGTFVSFDYPGATETSLNGINDSGRISGRYTDAAGIRHGFIARIR